MNDLIQTTVDDDIKWWELQVELCKKMVFGARNIREFEKGSTLLLRASAVLVALRQYAEVQ